MEDGDTSVEGPMLHECRHGWKKSRLCSDRAGVGRAIVPRLTLARL